MSETKWNSQLFSEHNTKKNKNIIAFNMKNRIKKIKNKIVDIEPFETIDNNEDNNQDNNEDNNQDNNEDIDDKEGFSLFKRDEFTGYDWDDPDYKGTMDDISGGISDIIQKIYDYCVYTITYTTDKVVDGSGKSNKSDKKYNKKIVRKYVGLFYCIPLAFFSAYNWYYIATFKDKLNKERSFPGKFLTQRFNDDGKRLGLADDLDNKRKSGGPGGIFYSILFFFFEYTLRIFDEFNFVFLDIIPEFISENVGNIFIFIFFFLFLLNTFYFSAEVIKDMFISIINGSGLGVWSGLALTYVIIKILSTMIPGSDPNDHYFSDWEWLGKTFAPTGIAGALILGFFLVINILRVIFVGSLTLFVTPILIGISILCYSFFAILVFSNQFKQTFKDIDEECIKDFKVKTSTICKPYTVWDWIVFFFFTTCKFFYDSLLSSSYIVLLSIAIYDYFNNIKGEAVKTNLISYTAVILFFVVTIFFTILSNTMHNNLKEAGLLEKAKTFDFNEDNINIKSNDLLSKINKDVKDLNNLSVNNLF